ncbi:MAG: ATP-binding cassette domain-containing protein [Coriobacteriales bacterium]|nr:ATP-binding cassette domain-containing protein [Coriobacteriales bacterium]
MLPGSLFLDHRQTLQQVSFCVHPGEWVVLLGANGSGKSTLARLANGLLLPNEGEVVADGISSWQHDRLLELRKRVGLVSHDADNQIVSTTVFDEVAFGPQNLGWEPERIYAAVRGALAQVGLAGDEFEKRDPNSLSGGEKQRVVIAALMAMEPGYLVLDEPTAMLDPVARSQVLRSIALAKQAGHGILQITHLLKEASFADRVLVLHNGKLVYDGAPEGILGNQAALTAYGLAARPHKKVPLAAAALDSAAAFDSAAAPRLSLNKVSFAYPDTVSCKPALENIDLTLAGGECLLLVGPSGSGKSTLLTLAAGLMQPTEGEVLLKGSPPKPGQVGLVFQQPETQLFAQTLCEDILFGPKNLGFALSEHGNTEKALIDKVLNAVGLEPGRFKHRSPFSLSGGEARRAAIATILALQTDFLLLDEPTAGLDARGRAFVYELVQDLIAAGKGIIIATHNPELFASLATSKREL